MQKLLSSIDDLRELSLDELLEQSPSWINLRFLANRFGYVGHNCKTNIKSHDLCEMIGLPCLEYGYQREVMLLAKYFGFGSAEKLPSRFSFEFLGMQPYPKSINQLENIDEERFNRDVIIARASLKTLIHTMRRTCLVKLILAKYVEHRYLSVMTSRELDDLLQEE